MGGRLGGGDIEAPDRMGPSLLPSLAQIPIETVLTSSGEVGGKVTQSTEKDKNRIEGEEVGRPDLGILM